MKKKLLIVLALCAAMSVAACSGAVNDIDPEKVESAVVSEEVSSVDPSENNVESAEESTSETANTEDSEEKSEEDSKNENGEMDSEERYIYHGLSIKIPDGFSEPDESAGVVIITAENYPVDADNINLTNTNESIDAYTEESINQTLSLMPSANDECLNYKKYTVDGYDAVSYDIELLIDNVTITQTQYVFFLNQGTSLIALTSFSGKYDEQFREMMDDLKIVE